MITIARLRDYVLLVLGLFLVVFVFCIIVAHSPFLLLAALMLADWRYIWAIIYAMDRFCAVLVSPLVGLQWDGHATVSSECGAQLVAHDAGGPPACRFCRWACAGLDFFDRRKPEGHCRSVARKNG